MAFGQFTLTRRGRLRTATLLRALVIAQLVIAVCLVIFCYNASVRVLSLLHHLRRQTVLFLYGVIVLHAYCMKLHYTMGLRLITLMLKYSYWPRVNTLCIIWMTVGLLVSINGLVISTSVTTTVKELTGDVKESLRVGITQYLTEPTWKKMFDTIQVELRCCGIERPSDWYEIPWINMDFLNEDSDVVLKLAGSDAKILPPVTPFSCCNPRTLGPCYHDPLQQDSLQEVWAQNAELVSRSLHEQGCWNAVRQPLLKAVYGLKCFTLATLVIEMAILVMTQALRTGALAAVLAGRPGGTARSWLLPSLTSTHSAPSRRTLQNKQLRTRRHNGDDDAEEAAREERGLGGASTVMLLLERRLASKRKPRRRGLRTVASKSMLHTLSQ